MYIPIWVINVGIVSLIIVALLASWIIIESDKSIKEIERRNKDKK